jgi:hypothetical protein
MPPAINLARLIQAHLTPPRVFKQLGMCMYLAQALQLPRPTRPQKLNGGLALVLQPGANGTRAALVLRVDKYLK